VSEPNIDSRIGPKTVEFAPTLFYYADIDGKPVHKWSGKWEVAMDPGDAIGYFRLVNPHIIDKQKTAALVNGLIRCVDKSWIFDQEKGLVFNPDKWQFEEVDAQAAQQWREKTGCTELDKHFYEKMRGKRTEPDINTLHQLEYGWDEGAIRDKEHDLFLIEKDGKRFWAIYGPFDRGDDCKFIWMPVSYLRAQLWHCTCSLFRPEHTQIYH
jgi:hypothetical protein